MSFLLVETGGLAAPDSCRRFLRDGLALARSGIEVSLCFLENGVTAAVDGALSELAELGPLSARSWADEFSLRQRGLSAAGLDPSVRPAGMDTVATEILAPGVRVVWH